MKVRAGEAGCASMPTSRAVCSVSTCPLIGWSWSGKGSAGASLLSHPLFAREEEEAEPDSVSVCQHQGCCPESQRRPRVPNHSSRVWRAHALCLLLMFQ